jgi:hypothetical protein
MKYLYLITVFLIFSGCSNSTQTPEEIFEKYKNSVVLIRNDYYFELTFSDGTKLFFTELSNGEILNTVFNEDEILEYQNSITGTGFFISEDGLVASNAHVTNPEISNDENYDLYESLKSFFNENNDIYVNLVNSHVEQIDIIDAEINANNFSEDELKNKLKDRSYWYDGYLFWTNLEKNGFTFNENNVTCRIKSTKLGIAYDNTHVTDISDFKDCIDLSSDVNFDYDLSIIQLKDKKTPSFISNFVDIKMMKTKEEVQKLKINSKVYMIGYNSGVDIGITTNGLANQITQGTVSQTPDRERVLYSIPSLPGSSGSPVWDEYGDLIAINYAGMMNTQSFNYGILSKHLITLYDLIK